MNNEQLTTSLLEKYSVSVPRYTSYPPAPEWKESFTKDDFLRANEKANNSKTPVSLYFHLPFCESQCYFCACNVVISKNRNIVEPYLLHLEKEIKNLSHSIDKNREVKQIHLGGGTPTYFTSEELETFFKAVRDNFNISKDCEIGVEVDPRVTSSEHLETLSKLGFNRLSMGIQDFDPKVQETINRIQPYEMTKALFEQSRRLGFTSINVDLIYGLPYQTQDTFSKTIELILNLNPDRIALFHYAHLPQLLKHQDKYIPGNALPPSEEKIKTFQYAVSALSDNGFMFIGLDHFAKLNDELAVAKRNKTLHRNFQGYTTKADCDLYGLGITAISNVQNTFTQNIKKLNPYYEALDGDKMPIYRGFALNKDDILRKEIIMKTLCHGEVNKTEIEEKYDIKFNNHFSYELERLKEFEKEGLLTIGSKITVTSLGQFFLRNIASSFDAYLQRKHEKRVYSKSI